MKSTTKRVTTLLIVASVAILGTLGLVRVFSYFIVDAELQRAMETSRIADLANKQRNIGQTVVRLAFEEGADMDALLINLAEMSRVHKQISTSSVVEGSLKTALDDLDIAITHIHVVGTELTESPTKEEVRAARKEILDYQRQLDAKMKRVHASLALEVEDQIFASRSKNTWSLIFGVVFLSIAIAIVAGPLRRRLADTIQELEDSQRESSARANELDKLRLELEAANSELKERHVRLRKAYDESASTNQFLMLASARFEDLFHGVPFPCFSVDANGVVFEWNEAASAMFGVSGHGTIQKPIFGKFFSLDNDILLRSLISEAFRGHHVTNVEIEANCPDGTRQLLVSVFPLKAARQEPTAALFACADITLQKDAEQRAKEANEKVGAILDSIKDAFVSVDRELVYRYVNNTAAEWLGLEPEQVIGKRMTDVTPQLAGSSFLGSLQRLTESGKSDSFDHFFSDSGVWLEFRVYPSEDGVSIFYNDITVRKADEETIRRQQAQLEDTMLKLNENSVLLAQQQLELEEANRNLQELATTDGLTGLLNHRAMQDELRDAVKTSARNNRPLTVALLDVDHFKKFNDSFGHQSGDAVLRRVAAILRESVRAGDIVARYGGEEFCVILPETDLEEAIVVLERIRGNVEANPWEQRAVTVSVGYSTGWNVLDTQDFLKQADQALYEAKAAGRNCVREFRGEKYRCA